MKKTKTIVVPLINGKKRRFYKSEIASVEEQAYFDQGFDVELWTKSGRYFLTSLSKKTLEERIWE